MSEEDAVEPLTGFNRSKKRAYRRPTRREVVRRCTQLSRELMSQSDSAGTGFDLVFLHAVKNLEGTVKEVDGTASSLAETGKTTDCASRSEFAARKGCTSPPRTSQGGP
jgi:hypothetical protein